MSEEGQAIALPDGRRLGFQVVGKGTPVFHFHDTPSSRLEVLLLKEYALANDVQIIAVDRPGVGLSTFHPHMSITNVVDDVTYLADHLRIDEFRVTGYSAGGPYAVTYTVMHPDRVTKTIVINGISLPIDTTGMSRESKRQWEMITKPIIGPRVAMEIRDHILEIADTPDAFLESDEGRQLLQDAMTRDEALLIWSPGRIRDVYLRSSLESVRQRDLITQAWIQEAKLFRKTWHVDLARIPEGRVALVHGAADRQVPVSHAHRMAQAIPGAQLQIFEDCGHKLLYSHFGEIFDDLF